MTTIIQDYSITTVRLPAFTILVHKSEEGETGYWGEVIEMPGCLSQGETIDELRANIQEAMEAVYHPSMTSIPSEASSHFATWPLLTETSTA